MEKFGFIKKKRTKFILAFISCVFSGIARLAISGVSGIIVYIFSYIRIKEGWVDMQYGNLIAPVMSLSLSLFSPLSGVLELRFGPIISILLSSIVIELCLFLFYLQQDIWLFYGITLLLGVGSGLSANILLKNICYYYPKKKGMINGVLMSIMGITSSFSSLLGEQIVNPNKIPAKDQDKNPYYPKEVAENVKYYFIFAMIAFPTFILLTIIFFYQYNPNCEEEEEGEKQNENNETSEKMEGMNEALMNKKKYQLSHSFYKKPSKANIKKVLKSFRFYRNLLITGLLPFYFSILTASFRVYIVMIGVDQKVIYYLGTAIGLIASLFGPIWAILVDKYGFQPIMKIIGFIISGMSIYFYFFIDKGYPFLVGFVITILSLIGIMMAMTPHLMNIFGMSNFLILMGFARIISEISSFSSAITSIVLAYFYKNAEDLKVPYQIVCVVGGALSIIGLVMIFYENDEKFVYDDENEENKYFKTEGDDNTVENETDKDKNYYNENASTILDPSNNTTYTGDNYEEKDIDKNDNDGNI